MKYVPIKNKVLAVPNPPREISRGGIIIPDTAKDRPVEATVIAIGDQCTAVNVGDTIYYDKFSGKEILIEIDDTDTKALIIWEDEIAFVKRKQD